MSTRKIKDATSKPVSNKTKKPIETTKKDVSKTKTKKKEGEEDEEKIKKRTKPLTTQNVNKKVSKPAPAKKIVSNVKPTSSRPATPPSSRVTKTQFFPSKKMYSNALKVDSKRPMKKIESTDISPDTSSMSERPRTATLRKGSIVNKNIVGPEVRKAKKPAPIQVEDISPQEYEDDFDSYESDFEAYDSSDCNLSSVSTTSTESSVNETGLVETPTKRASSAGTDDEKKLDSGNYELPESRHIQILDNINESSEKENTQKIENNLGSLSDEGFEEGHKSMQFMNFLGAQKKYQHRKSVELRRKRGEKILSMIKMDQYNYTLLDLPPVPYDVFIKSFGKSNSVQVSIQTGEDDIEEEVQTDEIKFENKWTQCPPVFSSFEQSENFWSLYQCDYLGVGSDFYEGKIEPIYNERALEKFLTNTGNLIVNIQAETNIQVGNAETTKSKIPFSEGFILYNTQELDLLKHRLIKDVSFCTSNKIVTVHGKSVDDIFERNIICIWSLANFDAPEMWLCAFGDMSCCGFTLQCPNLIFGGLNNGTITVWDTSEKTAYHRNVFTSHGTILTEEDTLIRGPTFTSEINNGHSSNIVAIQAFSKLQASDQNLFSGHNNTTELCSLDESGEIIIWSVITKENTKDVVVENQGLVHWGTVILTINTKISLQDLYPEIDDFKCTDLAVSYFDSTSLLVSTSYGVILHCLASGGKTSAKKFSPETQSQANCLEMCPFSSDYFLAGFDNGDISFYSRTITKPLLVLSNRDTTQNFTKITKIQWSHNRPLLFYTIDVTNTIHVWNLKTSDMFPIFSIPFKDNIIRIKLSPMEIDNGAAKSYIMIATDNGLVSVHLLGAEHDQQPNEEFNNDKKLFFNYINRHF